jgi:hypothetical protein
LWYSETVRNVPAPSNLVTVLLPNLLSKYLPGQSRKKKWTTLKFPFHLFVKF